MKKLSIVLALLLVAALVFGGVSLSQKGNLQKQLDEKVAELTKTVSESDAAKTAQSAAEEAAAALQEQIASLTAEKDEAVAALTAEKEAGQKALADLTASLEEKAAAAAGEAEAALAAEKEAGQKALDDLKASLEEQIAAAQSKADEAIAALTAEKEEAQKALTDLQASVEEKVTAAAAQAEGTAAEAAAAAEALIASLTTEKEEAQKALEAAEKAAAAAEGKFATIADVLTADLKGKTVILHSNDVHGAIDGYAYMAQLRTWFEAQGASQVILADAGDFSQGTTYVSTTKGYAAVEMMNAAKYDVVTLGNHEFDFGFAQLMENLKDAQFQTISANVILDETGEPILPGTAVFETKGGVKIAFVGLETPETATKVNPGLIKEITIQKDIYAIAQAAVDSVREEADIVIGLFHLGVAEESKANGYRSIDVLNNVTGIDFVLDGHSHTVMTEGENGEPIQSTGTKFAYVGAVIIDDATKEIVGNTLYSTAGLLKDKEVEAKAKAITDKVDAQYNAVFATTEVLLNGEKAPGNRTEETNMGDLITDAMVWSVVKEGGIEQVEPHQVVGITNGGGIRATINVGDVTMRDINTVMPFGNTVAVIYVTGEELLEALEASTFCTPGTIGGYPQTSGIRWTLDTTKEFDQGEMYVLDGKETTYYKPASIQRVTISETNGVAFDPAAVYAVVTNNFCAAGGDTYNAFARAYSEGSGFDTGIPMDQAVMAYVEEALNGAITAEAYGVPQGRVNQIQ